MGRELEWSSLRNIATNLLDGNPIAIIVTAVIAFGFPLVLHYLLYRKVASPPSTSFILLGPSGAGKTALLSLLESKSSRLAQPARPTHTSQTSTFTTVCLPPTVPIASNRYRSVNDPSLAEAEKNPVKYHLRDTPGHGKLRDSQGIAQFLSMLDSKNQKSKLRAVIFVVDSAALSEGDEVLRDTATYLHDILLILQKRALNKGKSSTKVATEVPVLVAANKQDLFTALPPASVRDKLEAELDRIRKSRSKGLVDASVDTGADEGEEEILGGDDGQGTFSFKLLEEEVGVKVDVVGGAVKGNDEADVGSGVRKWEEWIGMCL
ncbi:signal recognition particle receptor beta subunit-domain-containing protein [Thermoascus aurantiacus ATCC 26904]